MPTLLRELLQEAGEVPSSQSDIKGSVIEDINAGNNNPGFESKYTSLMGNNNIIEPQQARVKMRLPTSPPQSYQMNNQNNFPNLNVQMLTDEMRTQSLDGAQSAYMNSRPPTSGILTSPLSFAHTTSSSSISS